MNFLKTLVICITITIIISTIARYLFLAYVLNDIEKDTKIKILTEKDILSTTYVKNINEKLKKLKPNINDEHINKDNTNINEHKLFEES